MDLNTQIHFTGQFFPWHRWFLYAFEDALKRRCGYDGVSPYWNWTIGHLLLSSSVSTCNRSVLADAPDFFESSFWKDSDPKSGLGGWGDPNKDYSVPDGGFMSLQLSYPSPHIVRRNFTLRPFDIPFVVFKNADPSLEANKTFLAHAVEKILKVPEYKTFQKEIEGVVRKQHSITGSV